MSPRQAHTVAPLTRLRLLPKTGKKVFPIFVLTNQVKAFSQRDTNNTKHTYLHTNIFILYSYEYNFHFIL